MNVKWCKSKYRYKSKIYYIKCIFLFLLCIIIGLMYAFRETYVYNIFYIGLNITSSLYFLYRTHYVRSNIKNNNLELTSYSRKIYMIHICIMAIYFLLVLLSSIYFFQHIYDSNYKIWIWYALILPMMYSDSVYLSGITAFGENYFASGDYLVKYDNIDEINEIKEANTTQGKMMLISLCKNGKEYGYDKLFVEEYHKLRLYVFQNRREA